MKLNEKSRLMDIRQTAEYLGLSEAALRKQVFLRNVGGLIRIGGRLYFDRGKLEKFLDEAEIKTGKNLGGEKI